MMELRKMDWDNLSQEYGISIDRLLPWPGLLTPFGGGWGVIEKGQVSTEHCHEENELFIIASGTAKLFIDDQPQTVSAGDVIAIPPNSLHRLENEHDKPFRFYALWWDAERVNECSVQMEKAHG